VKPEIGSANLLRRCRYKRNALDAVALFVDPSAIPHRRGGQGKETSFDAGSPSPL